MKLKELPNRIYRAWNSSISRRVVSSTIVMTVVIAVLGGLLIMNWVTDDVLDGKRQASQVEAVTALGRMQNQLDESDLGTDALFERLGQLAVELGAESNQYGVVMEAGPSVFLSKGMTAESVPESLKTEVKKGSTGIWITPTTINYQDGSEEAGLAIGGNLQAPAGTKIPVYFLFPQDRETQIVEVVQRALLSVGVLLIIALVLVVWFMSRQVTVPVRQARDVAQLISEGQLDERLEVKGNDELADLAKSMNSMASTLQSQIVRLEQLSKVQQQFVSDVSHELRTPLTTMRMAVDVLYESRDELSPTNRRTTELLHSEIGRFEELLADLLEISRFDAGAVELSVEDTDLNELCATEVEAIKPLADQTNTTIELRTADDAVVECDPRRVRRIITNLLSNAIGHSEGKPIIVTCASNEQAVAITVRDHGVGFRPDQSELVFNRFWRADPSRTRVVGGSGLGLSIAREDAELHNGKLDAWGRPGQGALFRLTLPRTRDIELNGSPLPLIPDDYEPGNEITRSDGDE